MTLHHLRQAKKTDLIEPCPVQDTFATGLKVEPVGDANVRIVCFVDTKIYEGDRESCVRTVVGKTVMPLSVLLITNQLVRDFLSTQMARSGAKVVAWWVGLDVVNVI